MSSLDLTPHSMRRSLRRVTGIDEIKILLAELQVRYEFKQGGRHTKLYIYVGDQNRLITMNNSGRQHCCAASCQLKQIRAAVDEMRHLV